MASFLALTKGLGKQVAAGVKNPSQILKGSSGKFTGTARDFQRLGENNEIVFRAPRLVILLSLDDR